MDSRKSTYTGGAEETEEDNAGSFGYYSAVPCVPYFGETGAGEPIRSFSVLCKAGLNSMDAQLEEL